MLKWHFAIQVPHAMRIKTGLKKQSVDGAHTPRNAINILRKERTKVNSLEGENQLLLSCRLQTFLGDESLSLNGPNDSRWQQTPANRVTIRSTVKLLRLNLHSSEVTRNSNSCRPLRRPVAKQPILSGRDFPAIRFV
jgi:hypothetical protein